MLFKPHLKKDKITDITAGELRDMGVEALLLDVDNTLSLHHAMEAAPGVTQWIEGIRREEISLIIISNARRKRVEPFAQMLGLPFISSAKKPLTFAYRRARKKLGAPRKKTAVVGDQLFTDMLGGHLAGVKCILLTPFKTEDSWNIKIRRRIERILLKKYGY